MRVGLFMPTMRNGWIISKTSHKYDPDWSVVKQAAVKSEAMGFSCMLAAVKLRGFDGVTGHWNTALDSFSTMAAVGAVTERATLFGSVAMPTLNPAMCARIVATISNITGGRFGVNMVTGWAADEYAQMGIEIPADHNERRYDRLTEYVRAMRELWETGRSNFMGEFYHFEDCMMGPTPSGSIPIVSAGMSDRGMQFVGELCEYNFMMPEPTVESATAMAGRLQTWAAKYNRHVAALPLYMIVVRDTDAEAEDTLADWRANVDVQGLAIMKGVASRDKAQNIGKTTMDSMIADKTGMYMGLHVIAGSAQTVIEKLRALGAVEGVGAVMCTFNDHVADLDRFGREVAPHLDLIPTLLHGPRTRVPCRARMIP